ncbi:unnamed protein product [Kuraishia capsulata CBS 1993]|uniref:Protein PNS1 n=1 Tax=Kuraishia capsulata CBS 1993 TaxID=1382522 RepID=W6MMD4_9ASCO|nr:uncharacterized protein KUCA_T00003680001 [Kuraishia capsulata CBS 1993]CDK27701.1 unnamed protein product [Kuraishia capsulata CBS 1993]
MSKKDLKDSKSPVSERSPLLTFESNSNATPTSSLRDSVNTALETTIFFQTRHEGQFEDDPDDPPPPYSFEAPPPPVESESFSKSFEAIDNKYKDFPFVLLFFGFVAGFVFLAVKSLQNLMSRDSYYTRLFQLFGAGYGDDYGDYKPQHRLLLVFLVLPVISSIGGLVCAYITPYHFMMTALLSIPISCLSGALIALGHGSVPGMVFSVVTALVAFLIVSKYSARIKFSAVILKIVIHVLTWHPGSWFVALFGSLFTGFVFVIYAIMVAIVAADRYEIDSKDRYNYDGEKKWLFSSDTGFILAFCLFTCYYTFEVIRNVIHVTISGIYGTWYYFSKSSKCPRYPALGAFNRAVTHSFGSICMGSLVSAAMRFTTKVLSFIRTNREYREAGSLVLDVLVYVASFFYKMLQFFNNFSYSYIALHGKDYVTSAYDTYHLLTVRGVMTVFSDCVIEVTLNFYVWVVSILSSFIVYIFLKYIEQEVDATRITIFVLGEFFISRLICNVTLSTLTSGFFTLLVVLAESPEILEKSYPEYYEQLCSYQPKLRTSLHVAIPSSPGV